MSFLSAEDHQRVTALYQRGLECLRSGDDDQAIAVFRTALVQGVHSAPLLQALGQALHQKGEIVAALHCHRRAFRITPQDAHAIYNVGNLLRRLGDATGAETAYRRALELSPSLAEAHNNLGSLLQGTGRRSEALECFRLSVALDDQNVGARLNLAHALREGGQQAAAVALYRAILAQSTHCPESADAAQFGLSQSQAAAGDRTAAERTLRGLLLSRPDWLEPINNLMLLWREADVPSARIRPWLRRILTAQPDSAEGWTNFGGLARDDEALDLADAAQRRALVIRPDYATAWSNAASITYQRQERKIAIRRYRRAMLLDPSRDAIAFNLGLALLADGQWAEGWQLYERRWSIGHPRLQGRSRPEPRWTGQSLAGQRLLLWGEQGFGDVLQACRFVPALIAQGAAVTLAVYRPLQRLLQQIPGLAGCVEDSDSVPRHDLHLPMMSLPLRLAVTPDKLMDGATPYLTADPTAAAAWKTRLGGGVTPQIGLVWSGDPRPQDRDARLVDARRSISLAALQPLLDLPSLRWVSLQKGPARQHLQTTPAASPIFDAGEWLADFADSAALLANLDLVITVDTAIAHLAGAMGKPVWILSRFDGCWRWQLTPEGRTPWYASARFFSQTAPGQWQTPIAAMAAALRREFGI